MKKKLAMPMILIFAAVLGTAGSARASGSWFSPTRGQATPGSGMAVIPNLRLYNNEFTCADSFANAGAALSGNRLVLTYRAIRDTGIVICPAIPADYGPVFRILGLIPGYYEVYEERYYCTPGAPTCDPPAQLYLGLLAVANGLGDYNVWALRPDTVDANAPFGLQIRNGAYGNCFVGFFDSAAFVARTGEIGLNFTVEYYPQKLCLVDLHPHGPAYQMSG